MIRDTVERFQRPPHSVSLPKGREDPRTRAAQNSGVPSPLGEKDRMRGDSVKHSTGFCIIATAIGPGRSGAAPVIARRLLAVAGVEELAQGLLPLDCFGALPLAMTDNRRNVRRSV
jgi:hypothetical protein